MHDWSSLTHVRWDCKYHIVFVPKYRKKKLYGKFRSRVGDITPGLVPATRRGAVGRASDARPHPYVFKGAAEVQYSVSRWFHKRQKRSADTS